MEHASDLEVPGNMGMRAMPPNTGRVALSASILRSISLLLLLLLLPLLLLLYLRLLLLLLSDEVGATGKG